MAITEQKWWTCGKNKGRNEEKSAVFDRKRPTFGGFAPVGGENGARWGCRSTRTATLLVVRPNNILVINEKARERKRNGDFFQDSGALLKCGIGAKKEKELRTAQLL